jgi:predicted esterase
MRAPTVAHNTVVPGASAESPSSAVTFLEVLTGDPSPTIARANILAIHGYGDTAENFVQWLRPLRVNARIWVGRGLQNAGSGRAWFERSGGDFNAVAPNLKVAAQLLEQSFRAQLRRDTSCGAPLIVGFSQGAMMAYVMAASHGSIYNTVIPVAGLLPPALLPSSELRSPVQVHAFHGTADDVIPFAEGQRSVEAFRTAGFVAQMHAQTGVAHTITSQEQSEIRALIERAVSSMPCPVAGR